MNLSRPLAAALALTALLPLPAMAPAAAAAPAPAQDPAQLRRIAAEAYVYLYPLVTMDVTRRAQTDRAGTDPVPVNRLKHALAYPGADFRVVVRPNFDTLYTMAWLDLSAGPVTISVPPAHGRYYLLQFLDMWTDSFALPGSRTSGDGAGRFALVAPGWHGALPKGVTRIEAPTSRVWLIGRTQTNGPADYAAVHAFQNAMRISAPAMRPTRETGPALDLKRAPKELVDAMPALDFLAYGTMLLGQTRPHATDWSQLERMRRAGLGPGFNPARLTPAAREALVAGIADGRAVINAREATLNPGVNGWTYATDTIGVYGNHFVKRAIVARRGLGANPPEDAVYLSAYVDGAGQRLVGSKAYGLHFAKGETPPAGAFWSVTMYDAEGFPVANPINRFALGDRDPLVHNPDGSLDLLIQASDPGGALSANWLPAPASGPFSLTIRIYQPADRVLARQWLPPAVVARP